MKSGAVKLVEDRGLAKTKIVLDFGKRVQSTFRRCDITILFLYGLQRHFRPVGNTCDCSAKMQQILWKADQPPLALQQALANARRHVPHSVSFRGTQLVIGSPKNHPTNWLAQDHSSGLLI